MEHWKTIKIAPLYEVSTEGRIRRNRKIIKPQKRSHGYLSVCLYDGVGGRRSESIHRLVALAFIPNPNNFTDVNHKDEDKQNNRVNNLEWMSHKDNTNYGTTQHRKSLLLTNGVRSRAVAQYTLSGKLVRVFPSIAEADRCGYARGNVCRCAKGHKNYSHAYGYYWRYAD